MVNGLALTCEFLVWHCMEGPETAHTVLVVNRRIRYMLQKKSISISIAHYQNRCSLVSVSSSQYPLCDTVNMEQAKYEKLYPSTTVKYWRSDTRRNGHRKFSHLVEFVATII
jgi:hypothetical protein